MIVIGGIVVLVLVLGLIALFTQTGSKDGDGEG